MENQSEYKLEGLYRFKCLPGGSSGLKKKNSAGQCRRKRHRSDPRVRKIPWSGRSPGGGHGNPLQCSCLENPMDGGAWWARDNRVANNRSHLACMHTVLKYRFYYNLQMMRATDQKTIDIKKIVCYTNRWRRSRSLLA